MSGGVCAMVGAVVAMLIVAVAEDIPLSVRDMGEAEQVERGGAPEQVRATV